MPEAITYDDPTVTIDATGLTLKRYYFPTGRAKRVEFTEIERVTSRPASWMMRSRLWGSSNVRTWMPLDMGRLRRSLVIELDLGRQFRPAFTPQDPDRALALLRGVTAR